MAAVAITVFCLVAVALQCEVAQAGLQIAGGISKWTLNIAGWEKDKTFHAGDVLAFYYPVKVHNVVVVNKAGYDGCVTTPNDKVYTSGKDEITLVKGFNYFICSVPGHCATMRFQINAI